MNTKQKSEIWNENFDKQGNSIRKCSLQNSGEYNFGKN